MSVGCKLQVVIVKRMYVVRRLDVVWLVGNI